MTLSYKKAKKGSQMNRYIHIMMSAMVTAALPALGDYNPITDEILKEYKDECIADRRDILGVSHISDELATVFTVAADAVYEIELAPDGTTGKVVYHEFHCAEFGYQWCGTNGCGFHIVVDGVAFERFGGGRPFSVTVEDNTFVIIPLHRGSCRTSDGELGANFGCYGIATWDAEENTFVGQKNQIKVKQMHP